MSPSTVAMLFFVGSVLALAAALRMRVRPEMTSGRLLMLAAAYGFVGVLHGGINLYRLTTQLGPDGPRLLNVLAGVNLVVAAVFFVVARNRSDRADAQRAESPHVNPSTLST